MYLHKFIDHDPCHGYSAPVIAWDESKRASNLAKHGLDFAETVHVDFDTALLEIDDREDYGECRESRLVGLDCDYAVWSLCGGAMTKFV